MNKSNLKDSSGISFNVLAKNEAVSIESLGKICRSLLCNIGDVIEFIIDPEVDSLEKELNNNA